MIFFVGYPILFCYVAMVGSASQNVALMSRYETAGSSALRCRRADKESIDCLRSTRCRCDCCGVELSILVVVLFDHKKCTGASHCGRLATDLACSTSTNVALMARYDQLESMHYCAVRRADKESIDCYSRLSVVDKPGHTLCDFIVVWSFQ
jgi:hypothetical protein